MSSQTDLDLIRNALTTAREDLDEALAELRDATELLDRLTGATQ